MSFCRFTYPVGVVVKAVSFEETEIGGADGDELEEYLGGHGE